MTNVESEVRAMATELKRRPITVSEYHRMSEAGILDPDERLELLRGDIIAVPPVGDRHRGCVNWLTRQLTLLLRDVAYVQVQNPIVVSSDSEPQPDLALLHLNDAFTGDRHVRPSDVFAVIEVADATRFMDFAVKVPLYAETGIRETWVVDLRAREIVLFRDVKDGSYATRLVAREPDRVSFEVFPDVSFSVSDVLGRPAAGEPSGP